MIRTRTDRTDRAFDDFYRAPRPRLLASLAAFSGDGDVAAEAVDEAFVRALLHWDRVSRMASPSGWLYRVAINIVRRQARRRERERTAAARLVIDDRGAAVRGRGGDLGIELRELVARLPDRQRLAVVLRYVADLPEADIARAMGVRRSTVSATLAKAGAHLQRDLADPSPSPRRTVLQPPPALADRPGWELP
jgi:RNA polymerase sigma-70 factor (ECF subfamily)